MRYLAILFFPWALSAQTLSGVVDIHAHADPDSSKRPRSIDAIDLAKLAKARGMRGFVIKNHYESTAAMAYLVRKMVPGIEVFGGIVLNRQVGGVNPAAIEQMISVKGGWGRVVSMPTEDAENQVRYEKANRPFVPVVANGQLRPEVKEVLALIARHNLTLATGHSSAEENMMLVREARNLGVERIVVTHPLGRAINMSIPQMQEAARLGAYLEFVTYARTTSNNPPLTNEEHVTAIRAVGPEHCILSSDTGQAGNPLHPDAMATLFQTLRELGFTEADMDRMAKSNPATLLGLP